MGVCPQNANLYGPAEVRGWGNLTDYLRFLVTLTAVVDPFLAIPFFIAFTSEHPPEDRSRLARVVALTVFLVLNPRRLWGTHVSRWRWARAAPDCARDAECTGGWRTPIACRGA